MQTVCRGSWMSKFTNNGKGPLHPRFFRVDPSALKVYNLATALIIAVN